MEWYEHRHDEDTRQAFCPETPEMPPERRLALRLSRLFGVSHCHLLCDPATAAGVAISTLFAPDLGERAALAGDEIVVIAPRDTRFGGAVAACGGRPALLSVSPTEPVADGAKMETLLSMSTRAILVEHAPQCLKNLHTVRNFCNKYDLWLVEFVREAWDARYEIDGKIYAVGAIGDWSVCDLAKLGIRGAAILTRDDVLSSLIEAAIQNADASLSAEVAVQALANLPIEGGAL